ncbi:MAG: mandelate racemase/muconate lactonizing enzyme family protein [Bryobacteraceae bacterium]
MPKPDRRHALRAIASMGLAPALSQALVSAAAAAPASAKTMRFSKYEIFPVSVPMAERLRDAWIESYKLQGTFQTHYNSTLVKLYTDEGLMGIADAMMPAAQAESTLKGMIGHTPWEHLLDDRIGGMLMAVYDIVGHATGMPACRLLATSPKPMIFHTYWSHCLPPDLMAAEAKRAAGLGYRVHKVKARPWQDPVKQAEAMCAVVPSGYRFWADANAWWGTPGRALQFIRELAKFHNYFAIESPVQYREVSYFRELKKANAPLRIAEHMGADPMTFLKEGLLDAWVVGGPIGRTTAQRAMMAEVTQVPLWIEYGTSNGVAQMFQAHQAAAYPGIEFTITVTHCLEDDFVNEEWKMDNGYFRVPQKPGLGVTLDMNAVEKYRVKG